MDKWLQLPCGIGPCGLAVLLAAVVTIAPAKADGPKDGCREILGSSHPAAPPFSWKKGDKVIGAVPAFVARVFSAVDASYNSTYVGNWSRVAAKADAGLIDAMTGSRQDALDASGITILDAPITHRLIVAYIRKTSGITLKRLSHPDIRPGAIPKDLTASLEASDWQLSTQAVPRLDRAFKMLALERVDFVVSTLMTGEIVLRNTGLTEQLDYIRAPLTLVPVRLIFTSRLDRCDLDRNRLEAAITRLHAEGVFHALVRNHLENWKSTLPVAEERSP